MGRVSGDAHGGDGANGEHLDEHLDESVQAVHADPDLQLLPRLLREWFETPDWRSSREWLAARIDQLPHDTTRCFQAAAARAREHGHDERAYWLDLHGRLYARAQRHDIESAYREELGAAAADSVNLPVEPGPDTEGNSVQEALLAAINELFALAQSDADVPRQVILGRQVLQLDQGQRLPAHFRYATYGILGNALLARSNHLSGSAHVALIQEALVHFDHAAKAQPRDIAPLAWATTQSSRGQTLTKLALGLDGAARAQALRHAANCFDLAALEFRRDVVPTEWSRTQGNAADVLRNLASTQGGEDRERTLWQAVARLTLALGERRRDREPRRWATTLHQYGNVLHALAATQDGVQRERMLRQAMMAFDLALLELRRDVVPLDWARTQNDRGDTLNTLAAGQDGIVQARTLRQALETCDLALLERRRSSVPLDWAATQNNKSNALNRLASGQRGDMRKRMLRQAVHLCDLALLEYQRDIAPNDWAMMQNNRGNALRDLANALDGVARGRTLRYAVASFDLALRVYQREIAPLDWAMAQHNKGNALRELALTLGDVERERALRQALTAYELALLERQRNVTPRDWAMTQNSRGSTLRDLAEELGGAERERTLRQAVACFDQALHVYRRDVTPLDWAMTHNNRGATLTMLAGSQRGGERERTLWQAVMAYDLSLLEHRQEVTPLNWAMAQNNRGNALTALAREQSARVRVRTLRQAVAAYNLALLERRREVVPLDWAMTQNNLGNALRDRAATHQDEARDHTLRQAVAAYDLALLERRRDVAPLDWAATQNNKGNALRALAAHESGSFRRRTLRQATAAYALAATCYPSAVLPVAHRRVMRALGQTRLALAMILPGERKAAELALAWAAVESGIESTRLLELRTPSLAYRQMEWAESTTLYSTAAAIQAERGFTMEAAQLLEAGRARGLSEVHSRRGVHLEALPQAEADAYQTALAEVTAIEAHGRQTADQVALVAQAQRANARLAALAERLGRAYPAFAPKRAITPERIAAQLRPDEVLLYLQPLGEGTLALALPAARAGAEKACAMFLTDLTADDLFHLAAQPNSEGAIRLGYLPAAAGRGETPLEQALDELLPALGQRLMRAVVSLVQTTGARRVVVVPGGLLGALPLHAAMYPPQPGEMATTPGGYRYVCDDMIMTYAPSGAAYVAARQAQQHLDTPDTLERRSDAPGQMSRGLVVGNPKLTPEGQPWERGMYGYLPYAAEEAERVALLMQQAGLHVERLNAEQATWQGLHDGLQRCRVAHLALHAYFDIDEPERSGLRVAFDEPFYLRDLIDQRHMPSLAQLRLVALSACQTAQSDFQRLSEETLGLLGGFLVAGAAGVIGSLWPVYDESTSTLMAEVWRGYLRHNLEPDEALRRAQQVLREERLPPTGAPAGPPGTAQPQDSLGGAPAITTITTITAISADMRPRAEEDPLRHLAPAAADARLVSAAWNARLAHPVHWAAFVYYGA